MRQNGYIHGVANVKKYRSEKILSVARKLGFKFIDVRNYPDDYIIMEFVTDRDLTPKVMIGFWGRGSKTKHALRLNRPPFMAIDILQSSNGIAKRICRQLDYYEGGAIWQRPPQPREECS